MNNIVPPKRESSYFDDVTFFQLKWFMSLRRDDVTPAIAKRIARDVLNARNEITAETPPYLANLALYTGFSRAYRVYLQSLKYNA